MVNYMIKSSYNAGSRYGNGKGAVLTTLNELRIYLLSLSAAAPF